MTNWNALEWDEVIPGFERKVVHGDSMTLVRVRFSPGAEAPVHSHHHEQFSTIVSGSGVFLVDGKDLPVSEGDILHFPGGVEHGLTVGKSGMELLDIFTPQREDFPASRPKP